jgi:hypothetical protein
LDKIQEPSFSAPGVKFLVILSQFAPNQITRNLAERDKDRLDGWLEQTSLLNHINSHTATLWMTIQFLFIQKISFRADSWQPTPRHTSIGLVDQNQTARPNNTETNVA